MVTPSSFIPFIAQDIPQRFQVHLLKAVQYISQSSSISRILLDQGVVPICSEFSNNICRNTWCSFSNESTPEPQNEYIWSKFTSLVISQRFYILTWTKTIEQCQSFQLLQSYIFRNGHVPVQINRIETKEPIGVEDHWCVLPEISISFGSVLKNCLDRMYAYTGRQHSDQ